MTHTEVAEWMVKEIEREQYIYQEVIVYEIESNFGNDFVYINDNGNLGIDKKVLSEFRRLTEDLVVWERGEKLWRMREAHDPEGKRTAE